MAEYLFRGGKNSMPLWNNAENDEQILQAAYLRGQHKMAQDTISRILGVSQPHVSRLLKQAEKRGWLYTELRFIEVGIPAEVLARVKQILAPKSLTSSLGNLAHDSGFSAPNVRIFESVAKATTEDIFQFRRDRLGRSAAGRLDELLTKANIVGIAWGRMVSALVEGLANLNSKSRARSQNPIQFLPVCAELIDQVVPEYSSSRLVERLNAIVNGGRGVRHSLSGVPAYVPKRYNADKTRAIWEYVSDTASHRRIFSGPKPLINDMDTVLTSVGPSENPVGGALKELSKAGGVMPETIRTLVVGDIGGILIPKPTVSIKERRKIEGLNQMWTGMRLDHLQNVVRCSTSNDNGCGSIVVALGAERALVIHEIVRLGLVNELIIDDDLAQALEALCNDNRQE